LPANLVARVEHKPAGVCELLGATTAFLTAIGRDPRDLLFAVTALSKITSGGFDSTLRDFDGSFAAVDAAGVNDGDLNVGRHGFFSPL
jgi:hypothetical protein